MICTSICTSILKIAKTGEEMVSEQKKYCNSLLPLLGMEQVSAESEGMDETTRVA